MLSHPQSTITTSSSKIKIRSPHSSMRPSKNSLKNSHWRLFIIFLLYRALTKPRLWKKARVMTPTCRVTWSLLKSCWTVEAHHPATSRSGTKSSITLKSTPFRTSTYTFMSPDLRTSLCLNPKCLMSPLSVAKHRLLSTTFSINTHKSLSMSSSKDSWRTSTDANL